MEQDYKPQPFNLKIIRIEHLKCYIRGNILCLDLSVFGAGLLTCKNRGGKTPNRRIRMVLMMVILTIFT